MATPVPVRSGMPMMAVDRRGGMPPSSMPPEDNAVASGRQPLGLGRFLVPFLLGNVAMFGLFWMLYGLVQATTGVTGNGEVLPTVDFLRLSKNFELESRDRRPPPEMPDRPEAPPEVPVQQTQIQGPTNTNVSINMSLENTTQVKSSFGLSSTDGEYLPIVKVAPMYPARAQSQGIEGWVLVQFTVTEIGTVINPVVLEAQPQGVFDEAAKKAVLKFKYKPRVENGKPIAVPNVQHLIRFELEK